MIAKSSNKLFDSQIRMMLKSYERRNDYAPLEHINDILIEMDSNLTKIFSVEQQRLTQDDLYVSLYYKFNDGPWCCANTTQRGMSIEDLLKPGTTFSYMLTRPAKKILFENCKQKAIDNGRYVKDTEEDVVADHKVIGSIVAYRDTIISNNSHCVDFLIFISTCGKKLILGDEKIVKTKEKIISENLTNEVFKPYVKRIKVEFLKEL